MRGIAQINFFKRANAPFMRTPALGKLSLKRHAGGAASKEEIFPAQLHKSIGQR
jgi:hypothetical protein